MTPLANNIMSQIKESHKVFFDPNTRCYYRGSVGPVSEGEYVAKVGFDEVEGKYLRAAEQMLRGGVYDTSHSSTIKATMVLDEVLGLQYRDFRLREAFRIIRTPNLVLSVDVATVFSADTRVLPLVEAKIKNQTYTRTTWDLAATGKNVSHILLSDEAEKQSVHDATRIHIENAANALKSAESTQLATILEGGTETACGDWGAMIATYADFSNRNPIDDIQAAITTLWGTTGASFKADTIAMHPRAWSDFISNTFVHNMKIDQGVNGQGGKISIAGFPTLNVIVDPGLTNTKATILSKNDYAILADGPTEAAQYRDEDHGADGYVIRQWTEAKRVQLGAARILTSVSA